MTHARTGAIRRIGDRRSFRCWLGLKVPLFAPPDGIRAAFSAIRAQLQHNQQVFGHQTPRFDGRSSVVSGGAEQMDRQPGNKGWRNATLRLQAAGLLSDRGQGRREPGTPALHCVKIDQERTKRIICFLGHILLRRS